MGHEQIPHNLYRWARAPVSSFWMWWRRRRPTAALLLFHHTLGILPCPFRAPRASRQQRISCYIRCKDIHNEASGPPLFAPITAIVATCRLRNECFSTIPFLFNPAESLPFGVIGHAQTSNVQRIVHRLEYDHRPIHERQIVLQQGPQLWKHLWGTVLLLRWLPTSPANGLATLSDQALAACRLSLGASAKIPAYEHRTLLRYGTESIDSWLGGPSRPNL